MSEETTPTTDTNTGDKPWTQTSAYLCSAMGVGGTTLCRVLEISPGQFEARMGISLLGTQQMTEEEMEACSYNPFHPDFYDNYASGTGSTEEEAVKAMEQDAKDMSDTLW